MNLLDVRTSYTTKSYIPFAEYLCEDGEWRNCNELSKIYKVHATTIRKRIDTYGVGSPLVLHKGALSQKVIDYYGVNVIFSKTARYANALISGYIQPWDRRKCKRDSIPCQNYGECQSKRIGIHSEKWIAPDNTDACYMEEKRRSGYDDFTKVFTGTFA